MLTPHLEKLIHQGKAKFRTFVCGYSGSNALPVTDNTWIVITGFTYVNFSDPITPIPVGRTRYEELLRRSCHQIRFRSSRSNNHYIVRDEIIRDIGGAGMDINQIVNGNFDNGADNWTLGTGWAVAVGIATHTGAPGSGNLDNVGFTAIPGRTYRLTYEVTAVAGAGTVQPNIRGTLGFSRLTVGLFSEEIVAGTAVQPTFFRSLSGAGNDISIDNIELVLLPELEVVNINGHYKFDCYLVHDNTVTVELVTFPVDAGIIQVTAAAPATFPLSAPPLGYGNVGFGGIAQITELGLILTGFNAFNLPLTREHTDPAIVPPDIAEDGMEIPVDTLTEIQQPTFDLLDGPRTFPIVNVEYVEILGTKPDWIRG